ncbi:MAG: pyridoxal-phosphate dependent enzyme [Planctomycetes bacterium]|nr:pyridoxal-phosphate dependent enzyme [Planctomycetota bacterium]MCB9919510.1 pyridoxal-phosphate dependent enzyme [Planctomycetota bacterium]
MISIADVREASGRIRDHVHRTPILSSSWLDRELAASIVFKCENFQKVGAFKARGACNAVFSLSDDDAARGVITHSSGNHAAALAWAASARGIPSYVVMPRTAPTVKIEAVRSYGAEIRFCEQHERELACATWQRETRATLVHPFENPFVIAGQGTAALELFEERPGLDVVIVPVGGGGLCSGSAIVTRAMNPDAWVIGAEPKAVDDAARSMAMGILQPRVEDPVTWGDGLLTGLGAPNFELMQTHGVRIVTVDEEAIVDAARFFLQRMKIVVEPSGATVLAALMAMRSEIRGKQVGAVISGGNTDFAWLPRR